MYSNDSLVIRIEKNDELFYNQISMADRRSNRARMRLVCCSYLFKKRRSEAPAAAHITLHSEASKHMAMLKNRIGAQSL